jgi:homoserine kinase
VSAPRERASAFAPASVGNVAIGFDILGFALDALGDTVSV